jgi:hypothetical protein
MGGFRSRFLLPALIIYVVWPIFALGEPLFAYLESNGRVDTQHAIIVSWALMSLVVGTVVTVIAGSRAAHTWSMSRGAYLAASCYGLVALVGQLALTIALASVRRIDPQAAEAPLGMISIVSIACLAVGIVGLARERARSLG